MKKFFLALALSVALLFPSKVMGQPPAPDRCIYVSDAFDYMKKELGPNTTFVMEKLDTGNDAQGFWTYLEGVMVQRGVYSPAKNVKSIFMVSTQDTVYLGAVDLDYPDLAPDVSCHRMGMSKESFQKIYTEYFGVDT